MAEKKILRKIKEYSQLADGTYIKNPDGRIAVGPFFITNRTIKHFVESRQRQNADLRLLTRHIIDTVNDPDYIIENPRHPGEILMAKMIPGQGKAVALPIDRNGAIKSVFFQRKNHFEKRKNQMIAFGGAADPSSFPSSRDDSLAASLPALQKRSLDSLP